MVYPVMISLGLGCNDSCVHMGFSWSMLNEELLRAGTFNWVEYNLVEEPASSGTFRNSTRFYCDVSLVVFFLLSGYLLLPVNPASPNPVTKSRQRKRNKRRPGRSQLPQPAIAYQARSSGQIFSTNVIR